MKEYKSVSVPKLVVAKSETIDQAVDTYFDIIAQESYDGWEFMQSVPITLLKKKGAFKNTTEERNVFIFVREVE